MKNSSLATALLLAAIAACDSPPPSDLDASVRALLSGPLLVGEVESFAGDAAAQIVAPGGSDGAEYLFVVSNVSTVGSGSAQVSVQADGIEGPPVTADAREKTPVFDAGGRLAQVGALGAGGAEPQELRAHDLLDDGGFHRWHRERERSLVGAMLGHLPEGGRSLLLEATQTPQPVPEVDDIIEINVNAFDACEDPDWQEARVEAVSDQAIVLSDLRNPEGMSRGDFEEIAANFDQKVVPLTTANFGATAREIGEDRTTIFYTVTVNELASDFGGLIGGFFFSRDLFPRTAGGGFQGCASSNEREMFYLLTADPDGEFGELPIPEDFIRQRTLNTVMHEHQHLINASRRLYVLGTGNLETVWLNEGLSHIGEELLFYQESGLSPRQNLGLQDVTASQERLDAVNFFQVQNLVRYILYLSDPPAHTPISSTDGLETRGASWSFLRFLADQYVEGDAEFFLSLVNSTESGIDNLRDRLGRELTEPLYRWDAANYGDDLVPDLDPVYRHPSWNFRSLLPALMEDESFPLSVEPLQPGSSRSFSIRGGSAAFMRFSVTAGERGTLSTLSGGGPPAETVRGTLIRIR